LTYREFGISNFLTFLIFGGSLLVITMLFAANGRWKKEIDMTRQDPFPLELSNFYI